MEILRLDQPQCILVIEDKQSFARRLSRFLENQGHTVFAYTGVLQVEGSRLLGTQELTPSTPAEVDLNTIQICFLDHYFEGNEYDGTSLTKILVPFGIKVCGMSSVDPANLSMMRYGAVCAYQKERLGKTLGI